MSVGQIPQLLLYALLGVVSKVPTLSWRLMALSAETQDDFAVSSSLALPSREQQLPSDGHRFL